MRHIAREARAWVVSAAICMQAKDVPADFPQRASIYPDEDVWLNSGDAVVMDPMGAIAGGPLHRERAILYAECDSGRAALARRSLDVAGHYGRPDVFRLEIDRTPRVPASFREILGRCPCGQACSASRRRATPFVSRFMKLETSTI